jgi:hypothetical protein
MMATTVLCVNNLFFPGNIPSTPGTSTPPPTLLEPSLDFSKSQNSQYIAVT